MRQTDLPELDDLWRMRHQPESLATLDASLQTMLHEAGSAYDLNWRLARLRQFQAMQADAGGDSQRASGLFAAGAEAAATAMQLEALGVEAQFWRGVNLIEAARRRGRLAALRVLFEASDCLERAMKLDETHHFGGPVRVWARMTHLKPLWLGGNLERALEVHRRALQIAPHNSTTNLYYAETLIADQQRTLARKVLQSIVECPDDPDWLWEQQRDRRLARELLARMQQREN